MRAFSAISKVAFRLMFSRQQRLDCQLGYTEIIINGDRLHGYRKFNSIVKIDSMEVVKQRNMGKGCGLRRNISITRIGAQQLRGFIGVGDGDEDSGLTKTYEERRVIGYSPQQLFAVVAAVDLYEDFVPWCQRSTILYHKNDEAFDAELQIGFKFLVERYISHVELKKSNYIKVANMFFKEVVSHLVGSFEQRCCMVYGPAVKLLEDA